MTEELQCVAFGNIVFKYERLRDGGRFLVGMTSEKLQQAGVDNYSIYFGKSKIAKIMENPEMTKEIIKQIPKVIEDPIIVMDSKTVDGSITMFGDTVTQNGKPVMVAMALHPTTRTGEILDFGVITSAYGRRKNNAQNLIDSSHIRYIDGNKKRISTWSKALGLQLPSASTYADSDINISQTTDDVNTRFSLDDDVEEVGSLVAVHNATRGDLERALELGALPSPSIAIVKAEQGHSQYGDYSLVFPRSTIDPEADSRNKVYGGDAWTPTHSNARIESKVNYDVLREVEQNIDDLAGMIAEGDFRRSSTLRSMGIEDATDMTPEEIARRMADRDEVRAAYLADKGQTLEPVRKEKVFNSKFGNDALRTLIDRIGEQRLAQINFALESGQSIDEAMGPDQNIIRDKGHVEYATNSL